MKDYLPALQLIVGIALICLILLQQRGTALGSAFGQEGGFYATRRGIQKKILFVTIACGAFFVILALLNLII